jgi:hypothetical protein
MSVIGRLRHGIRQHVYEHQVRQARRLLTGARAWDAMDRLGIPGHGIALVRLDFPPDLGHPPRWGQGAPWHARLLQRIDSDRLAQNECLERVLSCASDLATWPIGGSSDSCSPALENEYLSRFDMAALYGMILSERPQQYVEIGSGMSTRVAAAARAKGCTDLKIVSIDPMPRVQIDALCHRTIRGRLEEAVSEVLKLIAPGDILFFDGSHRALPGSDVVVFFLEILDQLPSDVLVHCHDIYLPGDYPSRFTNRLWSENYLMGVWLLGQHSHAWEVILPCARMLGDEAISRQVNARLPGGVGDPPGSSFWLRRKRPASF